MAILIIPIIFTTLTLLTHQSVLGIITDATILTDDLSELGLEAQNIRDNTVGQLENFCPGVDLEQEFGANLDVDEILTALDDIGDFIVEQSSAVAEQVKPLSDILVSVDSIFDTVLAFKGVALYIVLPVVLLTTILLIGTLLASLRCTKRWLECILTDIIMRLLLLVSIIFWIIGSIFAVIAFINADLCSGGVNPGSPDGTIFDVLESFELPEKQPEVYRIIQFYISDCKPNEDGPFAFLSEYNTEVDSAVSTIVDWIQSAENTTLTAIEGTCGSKVSLIVSILIELTSILGDIVQVLVQALDIVECERINYIYDEAVHEGICANLSTATARLFAFLIIIGISGLMIVTFRASWLEHDLAFHENEEEVDVDSFVENKTNRIGSLNKNKLPQTIVAHDESMGNLPAPVQEDIHSNIYPNESSSSWENVGPTESYRAVTPLEVKASQNKV